MRRMKLSRRALLALVLVGIGGLGCLYLGNASWLAAVPRGVPQVVAQRGVAQQYLSSNLTDDSCTARLILPPTHSLIDNTLPSIDAALTAGADIVEADIRVTKDRQFVLLHDVELGCRTEGTGRVSQHTVAELQRLDVGYGYTADGGKSFPLRGKGVGLMPTLAQVLQKYPEQRFLIQIKDGERKVADSLVAYLRLNQLEISNRLSFFGAAAPLNRLKQIVPAARTWSAQSVQRCLKGYVDTGWFGHVPLACEDGMAIVPVDQADLLWGWPNRFLARMRAHHTQVMLIGRVDGLTSGNFSRLDTLADLSKVPAGFDGLIWTDQIRVIGPALRVQKNSP